MDCKVHPPKSSGTAALLAAGRTEPVELVQRRLVLLAGRTPAGPDVSAPFCCRFEWVHMPVELGHTELEHAELGYVELGFVELGYIGVGRKIGSRASYA